MTSLDKKLIRDALEAQLFTLDCSITKRREMRLKGFGVRELVKTRKRVFELFQEHGGDQVWWEM